MSYIDKSLGQNERVIARARLSWLYRAGAWTALGAGLAVAGTLFFVLHDRTVVSTVAASLAALTGVAAFLNLMIPVWTTEIAVTNQRLIIKKGLFRHSSEELQLWSIEEVDWEQGLIDRLFGIGRLVVCGTGDEDMRLPPISDALTFRRAVQQAISEVAPRRQAK